MKTKIPIFTLAMALTTGALAQSAPPAGTSPAPGNGQNQTVPLQNNNPVNRTIPSPDNNQMNRTIPPQNNYPMNGGVDVSNNVNRMNPADTNWSNGAYRNGGNNNPTNWNGIGRQTNGMYGARYANTNWTEGNTNWSNGNTNWTGGNTNGFNGTTNRHWWIK